MKFKPCPACGAHLDPGEICDCTGHKPPTIVKTIPVPPGTTGMLGGKSHAVVERVELASGTIFDVFALENETVCPGCNTQYITDPDLPPHSICPRCHTEMESALTADTAKAQEKPELPQNHDNFITFGPASQEGKEPKTWENQ